MTTAEKRIIATFTPQEWIGGHALNLEEKAREVDVTSKILTMPLAEIKALSDDDYETDDLVSHDHDGPFKVEVVDSILEFFGVLRLDEITQAMLDSTKPVIEARKQETRAYFTVTADITDFGQFDPATLREAIAEGISRIRNEGQLTPLGDETTEVGEITVRHDDDDTKEIIEELYEALEDVTSMSDKDKHAVLKRAGTYLGIDAEMAG